MKGFDHRAALAANQALRLKNPDMGMPVAEKLTVSSLSARFLSVWYLLHGPKLIEEVRFHPTRKFRADYAHMPTKTLIEIEGGIWTNGAHNRGNHYSSDCEKYNLAALQGYRVFRFTEKTLREPSKHVLPVIDFLKREEKIIGEYVP